jgi:hypothetical protein
LFRQTYPGSKCRACEREYSRRYYTGNTVAVRERQSAYRDENIELVRRQERESKKRAYDAAKATRENDYGRQQRGLSRAYATRDVGTPLGLAVRMAALALDGKPMTAATTAAPANATRSMRPPAVLPYEMPSSLGTARTAGWDFTNFFGANPDDVVELRLGLGPGQPSGEYPAHALNRQDQSSSSSLTSTSVSLLASLQLHTREVAGSIPARLTTAVAVALQKDWVDIDPAFRDTTGKSWTVKRLLGAQIDA